MEMEEGLWSSKTFLCFLLAQSREFSCSPRLLLALSVYFSGHSSPMPIASLRWLGFEAHLTELGSERCGEMEALGEERMKDIAVCNTSSVSASEHWE